MTRTDRN